MAEQLVPVQASIGFDTASRLITEVHRLRKQHQLLPLAVVVLDAGGHLVSFAREDGCGIMRFDIAFGKAFGALGMGMSSRQIRDRLAGRPTFQSALAAASGGRFIPTPGGVLIVSAAGQAVGAVGISGDASDKDEFCAIEAIKLCGLSAEPMEPAPNWSGAGL